MNPSPLKIYCDSVDQTWSLSLETTRSEGRAFRLACGPLIQKGSAPEEIVAEIREPRQVDAVIARVGDAAVDAQDLAVELMDLLLTLAVNKPTDDCVAFLTWRLCEWVIASRRNDSNNGYFAA